MSIVSEVFLAFLVVLWLVYFVTPHRYRWVMLLAASYLFYAYADIRALGYILATTVSTFLLALWIERIHDQEKAARSPAEGKPSREELKQIRVAATRKRKGVLVLGLLFNFGILAVIKYADFVIENINSVLAMRGSTESLSFLAIALPLGISFYTFQSMGYLIDVYRKKYKADRNPFKFALFVSFFPQLIQGPISQYDELAHQLYSPRRFDSRGFAFGLQRMLYGYFKKMVIADRVVVAVSLIYGDPAAFSGPYYLLGSLLYAIQIYMDFSGGIDIITGLAETLGITMTPNFARPYFARSLTEFWQRWHMSLGRWMREYIFYPLSLSKGVTRMGKAMRAKFGVYIGKTVPVGLASLVVFLVVGIWHGASWNFILFGLANGILISAASMTESLSARVIGWLHIRTDCFSWRLFQMLRTFLLINFCRFLSIPKTLENAFMMIGGAAKALVSPIHTAYVINTNLLNLGMSAADYVIVSIGLVAVFIISLLQERGTSVREALAAQNIAFRWVVYLVGVFAVILFGIYGMGYTTNAFVYGGL